MTVITEEQLKEIRKHLFKDCDGALGFPTIVEKPKGKRQPYEGNKKIFDHVYVEQYVGYMGDDYSGYMYYPVDNKYIKVSYSM